MTGTRHNVPAWFIIVIVVMMLPLLSWPMIVTGMLDGMSRDEGRSALVLIFPAYALLSGWLAYRSYARRPEISWTLLAVLLLAYVAVAFLTINPQP